MPSRSSSIIVSRRHLLSTARNGILFCLLAGYGWTSAQTSGENLLLDGQSRLDKVHELIRERVYAQQEWAEEKIYLANLIASLHRQHTELVDQLHELGPLVERREADWKRMEAQATRAEEIANRLAPVVNGWIPRVKALLPQAPKDLAIELSNELEVLEQYQEMEPCKLLTHRLETLIGVLDKLNQVQEKAIPVIETWEDPESGKETVRVIYLGLGAALYQVSETGETGWYRYSAESWKRVPVSGAKETFLDYWNALESGLPIGIYTFPYPPKS